MSALHITQWTRKQPTLLYKLTVIMVYFYSVNISKPYLICTSWCLRNTNLLQINIVHETSFSVSPRSLTYNESQSLIGVQRNQNVNLTLNVIAFPENIHFTWKFGEKQITNENSDFIITNHRLTTTLTVHNFTLKHVSNYSVKASNGIAEGRTYRFQILVKGKFNILIKL